MKLYLVAFLAVMLAFSVAAAWTFLFAARRENPALTALPRHKIAGMILGAWIIFFCVPHVMQLLEGSVFASPVLLYVAAVFLTVLIWRFADYHFARGIAVALIYMAYLMLREGYALNPPCYPVFAVLFFLTGSLGIVIGAKPVWLRDWLNAAQKKNTVRLVSGISFAAAAAIFAAALAVVAIFV